MKFGAEILPYHDYGLEVSLRELRRIGFRNVNLWSSAPPLAAHVNPGDNTGDIRRLLRDYGIYPTALTMYGKTQQDILERVEFAAELGIDTVVFDCEANYVDFVEDFLPPIVDAGSKVGVRVAVENHLTVPFTEDFEAGGHETERWDEGVDTLNQIKRLIEDVDSPYLGVCLAPSHLWVVNESICAVIDYLMERDKLFFYYIWDIDRDYHRGVDGLNFGPGEFQLPREGGTLNHGVLLRRLEANGYRGVASLKCHGTAGWPLDKVAAQMTRAASFIEEQWPGEVRPLEPYE